MRLEATAGRVIVKRDDEETITKGGIMLPDTAKEKPRRGKVLALGKGPLLDNGGYGPVELAEGMVVFFSHYAGNEVTVDGEVFLVLDQKEVIAVAK